MLFLDVTQLRSGHHPADFICQKLLCIVSVWYALLLDIVKSKEPQLHHMVL